MGADSEVGRLRSVLVHRPGPELRRVTPRTRERLEFDKVPWVARAQQEHDALTDALREHGAEVWHVTELLQDVMEYGLARDQAIDSVLAAGGLGADLGGRVAGYLGALPPADLAVTLVAGLTAGELRSGGGLVYELAEPRDFVVEPLPNLVFTRDSSAWVGDQVVIASLPGARRREAELMAVIYASHPRFAGARRHHPGGRCDLDCGDLLLLGPGVVAVGVGARTSPAAAERLAGHLIGTGTARSVLAVPVGQRCPGARSDRPRLDSLCTVAATGTVIMTQAAAFTLTALSITAGHGELRVSRPGPFLGACAAALGIDGMTVIDAGLDPQSVPSGQWDDGGSALVVGDRVMICDERNVETAARLRAAGFDVLPVPATELGGIRGGPRSMCAPVERDPAAPAGTPGYRAAASRLAELATGRVLSPANGAAGGPGELPALSADQFPR